MYIRKTRDRWDIQTNYGYGWEVECSEYDIESAKKRAKEYMENSAGRWTTCIKKRREKIV